MLYNDSATEKEQCRNHWKPKTATINMFVCDKCIYTLTTNVLNVGKNTVAGKVSQLGTIIFCICFKKKKQILLEQSSLGRIKKHLLNQWGKYTFIENFLRKTLLI